MHARFFECFGEGQVLDTANVLIPLDFSPLSMDQPERHADQDAKTLHVIGLANPDKTNATWKEFVVYKVSTLMLLVLPMLLIRIHVLLHVLLLRRRRRL